MTFLHRWPTCIFKFMSYSEVSLHYVCALVVLIPFPLSLSYQCKSVFSLVEAALKNLNDKTKDLNQFHVVNCINYGIFKII